MPQLNRRTLDSLIAQWRRSPCQAAVAHDGERLQPLLGIYPGGPEQRNGLTEVLASGERRWQAWILDLSRIEFGGPEQADVLIERARKQLEFDKLEYAVDSLRWALRKRPDDPLALRLLGETLTELKGQDAALFAFRRLVAVGRAQADPSLLPAMRRGMQQLAVQDADQRLVDLLQRLVA